MLYEVDTIAAISTPLGEGGIGIVRISGEDSLRIADRIFKGKVTPSKVPTHAVHYGKIIDPNTQTEIDEVLLIVMRKPHTYTTEDVVEINTHGGIAVLKRILQIVLDNGARLAERGEFTKRAFLGGRLDLSQAEAVIDIIRAKTEEGLSLAYSQLQGRLSHELNEIKDTLVNALTLLELSIDFPEEDVEEPDPEEIKSRLAEAKNKIISLIHAGERGKIVREGVSFAITGRTNVGKSSLFNALLLEDRAIVTPYPGTTRDIIEGWIDINGIPIKLIDTAGIRDSDNPIEQLGVERTRKAIKESHGILFVLDKSTGVMDEDLEILEHLKGQKIIGVLNKSDLGGREDGWNFDFPLISVSALKHTNIDKLTNLMKDVVVPSDYESPILARERHIEALKGAAISVNKAYDGITNNQLPELISYEIKEALNSLGKITGETTPEDVLDKIFNEFCIGK
ncbi:MAG TPA: tRNA uridine-5-carboxymethylaminomethyl(34) synthesis GTPase MnmE [bacterium (Candidatus Stahlbacteria)]|nr:tRNA uridine-5-carboxymethylaminomethyl(34) synthesis GTPase MnmE [Candidatus Stahlbacteria bacterium]